MVLCCLKCLLSSLCVDLEGSVTFICEMLGYMIKEVKLKPPFGKNNVNIVSNLILI